MVGRSFPGLVDWQRETGYRGFVCVEQETFDRRESAGNLAENQRYLTTLYQVSGWSFVYAVFSWTHDNKARARARSGRRWWGRAGWGQYTDRTWRPAPTGTSGAPHHLLTVPDLRLCSGLCWTLTVTGPRLWRPSSAAGPSPRCRRPRRRAGCSAPSSAPPHPPTCRTLKVLFSEKKNLHICFKSRGRPRAGHLCGEAGLRGGRGYHRGVRLLRGARGEALLRLPPEVRPCAAAVPAEDVGPRLGPGRGAGTNSGHSHSVWRLVGLTSSWCHCSQLLHVFGRDSPCPPVSFLKTSGGIFHDLMIHHIDQGAAFSYNILFN